MERFREKFKNNAFMKTAALVVICIAVNLLLSFLARTVNYEYFPLYLDSVGTMAAAMLGGPLAGVLTGFATNAINAAFTSGITLYYGTISVLVALLVRFFFVSGYLKKFWKRLLSAFGIAVMCGLLGGILTWLMYGYEIGTEVSAPLARIISENPGFSPLGAVITADLAINIADKIITLGIAYLIVRLLPEGLKAAFGGSEGIAGKTPVAERFKKFNRSLLGKVTKAIIVCELILAIITVAICYYLYETTITEKYENSCKSATQVAIHAIDPQKVDGFIEERNAVFESYLDDYVREDGTKLSEEEKEAVRIDPYALSEEEEYIYSELFGGFYDYCHDLTASHMHYSEDYIAAEDALNNIKDSFGNLQYLYVYRVREEVCQVVFDVDPEAYAPFVENDASFASMLPALLAGENIDVIITNDTYGWLMTYYDPLRGEDGKCLAYVCADVSMDKLRIDQIVSTVKIITILIGALTIILVIIQNIFNRNIVKPFSDISYAASHFAFSRDGGKSGYSRIMALDIDACVEIEDLGESLKKLASDSTEYVAKIESDAENMSKLQEGIILDFANMVENRDKNTGDHIKKTSLYVQKIAEELRREGVYADVLTDGYIADLVRSAPLHDIGKIRVSDLILNKPGRLTEDEFEIMKLHTTAGAGILTNSIVSAMDPDYLKVAIDMAHYHHEWWNGKGYPTGISGEDIPLSARIMAVADVFDALVSRRSYKDPFPFDKAIDIIRSERGTHFDPAVVDAFLNICEEYGN
ncbi:MAG: HD domain-containing protein [Clostridia bacterium]|nr:HD domain-containing protein [Clostridia bacterium]